MIIFGEMNDASMLDQ